MSGIEFQAAALTAQADQRIADGKQMIRRMVDDYRRDTAGGLDPAQAIGTQIIAGRRVFSHERACALLAIAVSMLADQEGVAS